MSIVVDGKYMYDCLFGTKQVGKIVNFEGVIIWQNWVSKTGRIASLNISSNLDWFETEHLKFDRPIIPKTVYCYFSYNYQAHDDWKDTSGGGDFEWICKDGATRKTKGAPNASIGKGVFGRPSSGTQGGTTTFTDEQIKWFKNHGGIVECWYSAGGGAYHGTQSCGGYINGYLQKGS